MSFNLLVDFKVIDWTINIESKIDMRSQYKCIKQEVINDEESEHNLL